MPSAKTEITEIVTGLAISGAASLDVALAERAVANVPDGVWDRLDDLERAGQHRQEFAAAWANGGAFLAAEDGLRGRPPRLVEWKGPTQAPGDEVVPADLRVDHVWLVSCKYLSKVLANAAPGRLFDRGLAGGPTRTAGDWYAEVAPVAYQDLFAQVRLEPDGDGTVVTERRAPFRERPRLAKVATQLLLGGEDSHTDELRAGMQQTLERVKAIAEAP